MQFIYNSGKIYKKNYQKHYNFYNKSINSNFFYKRLKNKENNFDFKIGNSENYKEDRALEINEIIMDDEFFRELSKIEISGFLFKD